MMRRASWIVATAVTALAPAAHAGVNVFGAPSDDRWHYPFNFSGGARPQASLFGSFGNPDYDGFNDRDAMFYIAWNTVVRIEPDLPPESYNVCAVSVVVTNQAGATWLPDRTVDEWFTYDVNRDGVINGDGVPHDAPGDRDGESSDSDIGRPIELFGLAFGSGIYSYESWNEYRPYQGAVCDPISQGGACQNHPRNPYPFAYQDGTGVKLHVEDSAKGTQNENLSVPLCEDANDICPFTPMPWAVGNPINYRPRNQAVPFDIRFDVDLSLSDGRVRSYFQEQLSGGRVAVALTTLQLVEEQVVTPGYPSLFTKESNQRTPVLLVWLAPEVPGDDDGDGLFTRTDFTAGLSCLAGPDQTPSLNPNNAANCRCSFDRNGDGDVDLHDIAELERDLGQ